MFFNDPFFYFGISGSCAVAFWCLIDDTTRVELMKIMQRLMLYVAKLQASVEW